MASVVIFGTGSIAQVAHYLLANDSSHEVVAFTVSASHLKEQELFGLPIVSFENIEYTFPANRFSILVAIGYRDVNQVRSSVFYQVKEKGYQMITYISSKCVNYASNIGENCLIFESTVIQPFTSIGDNVTIWSGSIVAHHSTIENHCFLACNVVVSGHVQIGAHSFLGANATIRDNVAIGRSCVVGAGALIMRSTGDNTVFVAPPTHSDGRQSDTFGF